MDLYTIFTIIIENIHIKCVVNTATPAGSELGSLTYEGGGILRKGFKTKKITIRNCSFEGNVSGVNPGIISLMLGVRE